MTAAIHPGLRHMLLFALTGPQLGINDKKVFSSERKGNIRARYDVKFSPAMA